LVFVLLVMVRMNGGRIKLISMTSYEQNLRKSDYTQQQ
jgi:hypothetical protein